MHLYNNWPWDWKFWNAFLSCDPSTKQNGSTSDSYIVVYEHMNKARNIDLICIVELLLLTVHFLMFSSHYYFDLIWLRSEI